jgi:hypothetical protein
VGGAFTLGDIWTVSMDIGEDWN